jgi:hypothetical protein
MGAARYHHGIKVLMAKNYIDNLSEETRKGMLEKAEQGLWPSFAPLGYVNEGRTIVPDPAIAPIIRKIFEWYATGEYSLAEVTKMAKAAGMVFRKSGNPVPKATIHKILHNRIYTRDFDFDGKTYRGRYEPIVSRELWEQVQQRQPRRRAEAEARLRLLRPHHLWALRLQSGRRVEEGPLRLAFPTGSSGPIV